MAKDIKAKIVQNISATGIIATTSISDESKIRLVIANASGSNIIIVRARIEGQTDWDELTTITANSKSVISVKTYDEIQIECTTYGSLSNYVRVVLSSFNEAGGSTTIDAPAGGQIDSDALIFTSSDSSVTITNDPFTNTIDFISTGGGGSPGVKYVKIVTSGDWTGPVSSEYTLSLPFSTHNIPNPVFACYETNGGVFDTVLIPSTIDSSNNIILTTSQIFLGKIIVE